MGATILLEEERRRTESVEGSERDKDINGLLVDKSRWLVELDVHWIVVLERRVGHSYLAIWPIQGG